MNSMERSILLAIVTVVFYYLGTVLLIFPGMKIRKEKSNVLLDKNESDYVKGIAALMVFLAHTQNFLSDNEFHGRVFLKPFSVLGGVGVLLFFFLSGYGIYKGYANKNFSFSYWKNRFIKVFIPALIISLISRITIYLSFGIQFDFLQFIKEVFSHQWYVDVVMLEYLVFFIAWFIARKNKVLLLLFTFIGSILIGFTFWIMGFNARWYNGVILFPFGMLMACQEANIVKLSKKTKVLLLVLSGIGFALSGLGFTVLKGMLIGDLIKSISGICLAFLMVMFVACFSVGNSAIRWLGKKSLYIYLCHLYILEIVSKYVDTITGNSLPIELYFFIILIGSLIYAEVMYLIFGYRKKKVATTITK